MKKQEKIALVIEGGGFKSVFSAGVLDAFLINKFQLGLPLMITIYHNPRCSKSRQTLELLNSRGIKADIRLYLEQILSADELLGLLTLLNMTADQLVRKSEQYFKDNLRGKALTEDQLIKAMVENPKLIERPIVVADNKAAIGRPPEAVLEIIE